MLRRIEEKRLIAKNSRKYRAHVSSNSCGGREIGQYGHASGDLR